MRMWNGVILYMFMKMIILIWKVIIIFILIVYLLIIRKSELEI